MQRAKHRVGVLLVLVFGIAAHGAAADEAAELEKLRAEIAAERALMAQEREALRDQRMRVEDTLLELRRAEASQYGDVVPAAYRAHDPAEPRSPELDVYGFVHADLIQDFNRVDPDWKATLRPSRIPVQCNPASPDPGCGNDGETILSVRQSRLGFRGLIPTALGDITTLFEFELFGVGDDAGETTFRLRHAWAELGHLGAGQTWSLFMDPSVFPNTIDYWGPVGMVFFRNPQVRWTAYQDENLKLALALESPGSALDAGKARTDDLVIAGDTFASWNALPDLTGQVRLEQEWGHLQFGAIVRHLGYEIRSLNGRGPDGYEIGAAGNLSGSFNLFENDQLLWQVAGGKGFAGYMNDGGTDLAPSDSVSSAVAVPGLGWLAYYNRQWSEKWTSSIGYSEHRQFTTRGQMDTAFETGQYANVNLLYHPVDGMFLGPEFVWGRRVNRNGDDGTDSRVQLSFHYDFGAKIVGGER